MEPDVIGQLLSDGIRAQARTVGLLRADGSEPDDPAYTRQELGQTITLPRTSWANAQTINFPEATRDWGTIEELAFYDEAGKMLHSDTLNLPVTVMKGRRAQFPIGALTFHPAGRR